jgi:hypothetical protein
VLRTSSTNNWNHRKRRVKAFLALSKSSLALSSHALYTLHFTPTPHACDTRFSLYGAYRIHQRRKYEDPSSPTRWIFRVGMGAYALGIVVWQIDLLQCEWLTVDWPQLSGLPNPQFHAWWHTFVSIG